MFDSFAPRDTIVGDRRAQAVPQEVNRVGRKKWRIAGECRQKRKAARTRPSHAGKHPGKRAFSWRFIGKQLKAPGRMSRIATVDQQSFDLRCRALAYPRQEGLAAEKGSGLVRTKPG